jgi:hypothetical protein
MRRPGRRSIILVSCIIVAAVAAFIFWPGEREPEYQGKTLSDWLLLSEKNRLGIHPNGTVTVTVTVNATINAQDAIRHFGTNALPYLIKNVQEKRTVPRSLLRQLAYKLRLPPRVLAGLRRPTLESLLRESATVHAFETLGAVAVPAVPELARIMYRSQDQEISHRAMNCLAAIRPEGLFILGTALTNLAATSTFKDDAIDAISGIETNASLLLPMLLAWLKETNTTNVRVAVKALGDMALRPDVSVPALTNKLSDPALRLEVIEALENFDKDAEPAIPPLIGLLTDTNSAVAVAAAEALGEIGEQPDTVVPTLAKTLTDHTNNVPLCIAAADALGRYGAKAQSAIPALKIAMADPRRALSLPAQIALQAITAQLSQTNGAGADDGAAPR